MSDRRDPAPDPTGRDYAAWAEEMRRRTGEYGFFEDLGPDHHAQFTETEGDCLLVSFESFAELQEAAGPGPRGREIAGAEGWSHLALVSRGRSWFRDPRIFGFFDQLDDDGLLDEFGTVLFHGAGPGGYAACAYSVAAPGARVLALAPQATLDPRLTEWDGRFPEARRHSFTDRYGYAPEMLDAAAEASVLYDPRETLDAMHAALFARPGVTRLRMPGAGAAPARALCGMEILPGLLRAAMAGELDAAAFARLFRARRSHAPYLERLLARLDAEERDGLAALLCGNVAARMDAPRFAARLRELRQRQGALPGLEG